MQLIYERILDSPASNGQDIKFTGNKSVEGEFPDRHLKSLISSKIDFFVEAYKALNKCD